MTCDLLQIETQIREIVPQASTCWLQAAALIPECLQQLHQYADAGEWLTQRLATAQADEFALRCAAPAGQPLDAIQPLPLLPDATHLVACDGSQRFPELHDRIPFALVNVAGVKMQLSQPDAPAIEIQTQLLLSDNDEGGLFQETITERRDLEERLFLTRLLLDTAGPALGILDGPLQLWDARDEMLRSAFRERVAVYIEALTKLKMAGQMICGYTDQPRARLVVRMLEVAAVQKPQGNYPVVYPGVSDALLFGRFLPPLHRSALFSWLSRTAGLYPDDLAIRFFYLNVSPDPDDPVIARVEVPAWMASGDYVDLVHALLVDQASALELIHYPFLLHRAHEECNIPNATARVVEDWIADEWWLLTETILRASEKSAYKQIR